MTNSTETKWLLLIHQIPPKPDYFRAKIWRRLQQVGAVAIKQSVYVLPKTEQAYEDLSWILKEITEGGGEASLCESSFLGGISSEQVKDLFQTARDNDYRQIAEEARALDKSISQDTELSNERKSKVQFSRLKRWFADVVAIDFFQASGRGAAEGLLAGIESRLKGVHHGAIKSLESVRKVQGRTWVTRKGVYVDRIACAWLIKRFIDQDARFKFVPNNKYRPKADELRFDMFKAEFTHEGDRCTFEVMNEQFHLEDPAIFPIAEIIHNIDLKDEKFARQEALGINLLFSGIAMAHETDEERLERGSVILDELYEYFRGQSKGGLL